MDSPKKLANSSLTFEVFFRLRVREGNLVGKGWNSLDEVLNGDVFLRRRVVRRADRNNMGDNLWMPKVDS